MLSLKDQLRALQDEPKSVDPESAYADLDGLKLREADREHYEDVGPSRLRAAAGVDTAQTLLTDKYGGKASSRMKIFDDDEEDDDDDDEREEGEEDDEDEEAEEDEDDEDEEEDDEEDDDEEDDEDEEEVEEDPARKPSGKALDPVGQLRESRQKDVEKGRGIKRQRDLFDSLLTMRIAFQKAVPSTFSIPDLGEVEDDPEGEIDPKRADVLSSLGELNETLFSLRELISLPGANPSKRRRTGDPSDEAYWTSSAADSFALSDSAHGSLVPVLSKWSTKIQAASLATAKFASKPTGVVDAIDAAISTKRDNPKPLLEAEEGAYRSLLREVIESRGGGDVMAHRREKKKKREAERGGSKGRKLRYTVHDKAVNFVVPIPLDGGWHEEQVDELFSSLFGGVGIKGAMSTAPETNGTDLGGLRMF
ncbi:hypothetical protein CcaverHIS002_0203290 [Cutaneotrichosporon cavernicola]|uniref:Protein BFR2 n=1 Tax=Cutaneotrichosporon cavernicola TaxID=279322 RepID=A0AA48IDF4_9TREE|nr:uncharacterized protein CcaverHIS019_0203280 [Cutaneotrichosporon cavernicola]BEI81169.1 hypothetical protein CcaverHIS002_0203290 [Cutaneotrichosporon cavernicola]BEI88966.1 hypothetical protein CcaverHIS019_0203280 [Cutaneotrichosporon cavernicola]BEI96743.1 hypothetical protein CcaverHIS631_0203320 [Cutaneotrichosporon cavernicola]BEJ04515.1 hypothetical protein CcaverHIS641_0203320 [Cutaneotrichosporon cavernicola]